MGSEWIFLVGFAMCLQGIILSASPLARLGAVLESRNADAIPFPISLNMVVGDDDAIP